MEIANLVSQFRPPTNTLSPPATFQSLSFMSLGNKQLSFSTKFGSPPTAHGALNDAYKVSPFVYSRRDTMEEGSEATATPELDNLDSPIPSEESESESGLEQSTPEPIWRAPLGHNRQSLEEGSQPQMTNSIISEEDKKDRTSIIISRKRKYNPETLPRPSKRAKTRVIMPTSEQQPISTYTSTRTYTRTSDPFDAVIGVGVASVGEATSSLPSTTDTGKKKDGRSNKPGYPYYGAEYSFNPPSFVSTPIPRPEIGLHALQESASGERPGYNYTTLIKCAILGSPAKKLTIEGIYDQLMGKFEYFRNNNGKTDKGWKNSIRHHLSLSACFVKKEKQIWESGKGSWWTVDLSVADGELKRARKRKPRTKEFLAARNASRLQQAAQEAQVAQEAQEAQKGQEVENTLVKFTKTGAGNVEPTNVMETEMRFTLSTPSLPTPSPPTPPLTQNKKLAISSLTGPSMSVVISRPPSKQTTPEVEAVAVARNTSQTNTGSTGRTLAPVLFRGSPQSFASHHRRDRDRERASPQTIPSAFRLTVDSSLDYARSGGSARPGHSLSNERTLGPLPSPPFLPFAQQNARQNGKKESIWDPKERQLSSSSLLSSPALSTTSLSTTTSITSVTTPFAVRDSRPIVVRKSDRQRTQTQTQTQTREPSPMEIERSPSPQYENGSVESEEEDL